MRTKKKVCQYFAKLAFVTISKQKNNLSIIIFIFLSERNAVQRHLVRNLINKEVVAQLIFNVKLYVNVI
jgi:hypothetical protein